MGKTVYIWGKPCNKRDVYMKRDLWKEDSTCSHSSLGIGTLEIAKASLSGATSKETCIHGKKPIKRDVYTKRDPWEENCTCSHSSLGIGTVDMAIHQMSKDMYTYIQT